MYVFENVDKKKSIKFFIAWKERKKNNVFMIMINIDIGTKKDEDITNQ